MTDVNMGTLHIYEPEKEEPEAEAAYKAEAVSAEEPTAGPVPVDLGEYEEPEAESEAEAAGGGQTEADGAPDLSGMLQLLAFAVAQMRYTERERQQRFIDAWLAEVGPVMEMLKVPEALAAMGWTAARGFEALPPWVRLALAGAWMAYAFKAADAEAQKGVTDGETIMDIDTGDSDRRGV